MEKVKKSEQEWRQELTPEQYEVVRNKGTEAPFTSELNDVKEPGQFVCVACGQPVFDSENKFDSGTGWPSFDRPMGDENGRDRGGQRPVHAADRGALLTL